MANPPVPSVDPVTGKLPDLVIGELGTRFASRNVLNVYDFGAIDVSKTDVSTLEKLAKAPSSQTAINAALAAAATLTANETRVLIQIPYGAIRGTITVTSPFICFSGPGSLVDGQLVFQPPTAGQQLRYHSIVWNMGFKPLNAELQRTETGIRIVAGASIEIMSNRFRDCPKAVHLDSWADSSGQQNKTIDVHNNQMTNVDYGLYAPMKGVNTWDTHADSKFNENQVRNAYISHVWVEGADGFDVTGNTLFHVGRDSNDMFHKVMKTHSVYFGPRSNFVIISTNKIFESGLAGIYLKHVNAATVSTNVLAWCGQNKQTPSILVETSADLRTGAINIDGNTCDEGTSHGIAVIGNGNAGNITIPDNNVITLVGDTARNVYRGDSMGNGPLIINDIARIFVASTVSVIPRITASQMPRNSRKGVLAVGGMYSVARRQMHTENYETVTHHTKTVTQGQSVSIGVLRSTGDLPVSTPFVGRVAVSARHLGSGLVARYDFTAASNGTNKTIGNLQASGSVTNLSDGSSPAFTFALAQAGTTLTAMPTTNTAGQVEFTVVATGGVQTSYTTEEFNTLALVDTM
jgi:hypothetical protein